MKMQVRFLLLFVTGSLPVSLLAQHTVNVAGNTLVDKNITYAYSVGEVTGFSLTDHCIYTPGVIQPTRVATIPPQQKIFDNYHAALVYPNPTRGIVIVETNEPGINQYTITSYDGKIVQSGSFFYLPINVQGLQPGLYLLTVFSTGHTRVQTFKIIKL